MKASDLIQKHVDLYGAVMSAIREFSKDYNESLLDPASERLYESARKIVDAMDALRDFRDSDVTTG